MDFYLSLSLSFSYVRAEVIAGFVNALFLLFISFFIFSEAIEVSSIAVYLALLHARVNFLLSLTCMYFLIMCLCVCMCL